MKNFFIASRTDFQREYNYLSDDNGKKYSVSSSYRMIEHIKVYIPKKYDESELTSYQFQIRVTGSEPKFYIVKNGGSLYMTIPMIYEALKYFKDVYGTIVINVLKTPRTEIGKFVYKEIDYELRHFDYSDSKLMMSNIQYHDVQLHLREVLVLISLIQEKSNVLFEKEYNDMSIPLTRKNTDGILRLLVALLEFDFQSATPKLVSTLEDKGWKFDKLNNMFKFDYFPKYYGVSRKFDDDEQVEMLISGFFVDEKVRLSIDSVVKLLVEIPNSSFDKINQLRGILDMSITNELRNSLVTLNSAYPSRLLNKNEMIATLRKNIFNIKGTPYLVLPFKCHNDKKYYLTEMHYSIYNGGEQ